MALRVHEREKKVNDARAALRMAVAVWQRQHDDELTAAEYVGVVAGVLGDELTGWAKYQIRFERHGDYETPGGWAKEAK